MLVGTVKQVGGSNVSSVPAGDGTAIVRVDEVVASPTRFGNLAGQDITVRLSRPARRGEKALFHATSYAFGEAVALDELERSSGREATRMREQVVAEKRDEHDADLVERLRQAELVVYGQVASVEQPQVEGNVGWMAAELLVWRILKGEPPPQTRVVFPSPRTHRFRDAPQFLEGQEGVWILHAIDRARRDLGRKGPPRLRGAFTALDELDFHSPAAGRRLRLLLLSIGEGAGAR
ncbi:MAG TPA: hypothetical protein VGW10_17950 [Solirubrobacteraceae bacterium]|nr:hypothetical protein [Solirubrobacteraceae bacterium]